MMKIRTPIILFCSLCLFLFSCSRQEGSENLMSSEAFTIRNFLPITNYGEQDEKNFSLKLDYMDANSGFVIPSVRQTQGGMFVFEFEIKNNTQKKERFFYKIYYQNESYKFPEQDTATGKENEYAAENFYGSWEEETTRFKQTVEIPCDEGFHLVSDSFRIVGNPRTEQRYFENGQNQQWQRNPRTGNYSFLLVVSTADNIIKNKIPITIQDISVKIKDRFTNPYFYFLFGEGKKLGNTISFKSPETLKVVAQPDLAAGVCIEPNNPKYKKDFYSNSCGDDSLLRETSAFQQFIHYVDESTRMENIPVIADVLEDNYSKTDYNWNKQFFRKDELISTTPSTTLRPCETVYADKEHRKIVIKNPRAVYGKWKKENVGIITRHGLTYGKYRAKVKLTEILNANNVWNGLTNAIWLIGQPAGAWNNRRICKGEGYMANYWGGENDERVPMVNYSEIDFEILKTPPYCPDYLFPPVYKNPGSNQFDASSWNVTMPDDFLADDDKITVACTNWDMACSEPKDFKAGCNPISYKEKVFESHRWSKGYRALTQKTLAKDDDLFKPAYYYFEIEWKPNEITWRIGPEPDKMEVVGYMDNTVTSIPNNQMLLIITQEFHNTKWWPGTPYSQDNIPFPKNDIVGEIYDITIE